MIKTFQIDYVRSVLKNVLHYNASSNEYFNDDDIHLFSFYEHLLEENEVNRYVELFQDLVREQNRQNIIGFGIVSTTNTPSITNLKTSFVSPFEWGCTIRCTLGNRDKMISTLYNLIYRLKGKKVDVAQFDNGKLLPVGSIDGLSLKNYDFLGTLSGTGALNVQVNNLINSLPNDLTKTGITRVYVETSNGQLLLVEKQNSTWVDISREDYNNDGTIDAFNVPQHTSFEKYKLDLSFDDVKVDEPFTLNAQEYCNVSFGGTATLCNNGVKLGNDMIKVFIKKNKIVGSNNYSFVGTFTELEPMEMPSGISQNSIANQLRSNYFKANSHTDSVALSLQYTFLCDDTIPLLKQWFNYARYGENNLSNGQLSADCITPNIIYTIKEFWSSWGVVEFKQFDAKLVEDINIENTESDVMTMSLNFQIQGANN